MKMKNILFAATIVLSTSLVAQSPEFKKLFEEGNMYMKAKSYTKAIPPYDKAIRLIENDATKAIAAKTINPANKWMAEIYGRRGMCYYFTGSTGGMKADAETALALDTANADAKSLIGYSIFKSGDKKKGCKGIRKGVNGGSEGGAKIFEDCFCWSDGVALAKEADSKANVQKWDEAIAFANEAIDIMPDSGYVYASRARGYLGKGEKEKALLDMNTAIAKKCSTPKVYYLRAQVYLKAGKPDSAFLDLNKCIELKKDNYDAILLRAQVNEELQQWNAAVYDYNLLTKMRPDYGMNFYKLALVKHNHQDDLLGACDCYKAAAVWRKPKKWPPIAIRPNT